MAKLNKIYVDLDLTFNRIPATGDVALRFDDQSVIASVRNLLLTNFYERPFQPDLGSNLNSILFEPATGLTAGILDLEIRNVITNYEPRVQINELIVTPNLDGNTFRVDMSFYIGNNTQPTAVNLILQRSR
jgi:phage baseplate assembly protein W